MSRHDEYRAACAETKKRDQELRQEITRATADSGRWLYASATENGMELRTRHAVIELSPIEALRVAEYVNQVFKNENH